MDDKKSKIQIMYELVRHTQINHMGFLLPECTFVETNICYVFTIEHKYSNIVRTPERAHTSKWVRTHFCV